jgi:hypothetical protein
MNITPTQKTTLVKFLQKKITLLLAFLVFWVPKIALSKVVNYREYFLLFLALTKAMQTLPI